MTLLLAAVGSLCLAQAAWQADGVPVCTATGDQQNPVIVPDMKGGGIAIWQDWRSGGRNLYAQRVNSAGNALWATNGVQIVTAPGDQLGPRAISDMRGGAIVAFNMYNTGNYDVWVQRVDSLGNPCWGVSGVDVSSLSNIQYLQMSYQIASDSAGGVYITWDNRDTLAKATNDDIYAQLIDSSGNYVWNTTGIMTAGGSPIQGTPYLVSSPNSAIIAWMEGPWLDQKFYAQRISKSGSLMWMSPTPICTTSNAERYVNNITSDGRGGIVVWKDKHSGSWDIYTQKVDSSGNILWQTNGVPVCTAAYSQEEPVIVDDGVGGVVISWHDFRTPTVTQADIYAQRIDENGNSLWPLNGIAVCAVDSGQLWPCIVRSDTGKTVISWLDYRSGPYHVYAQAVDENGGLGWAGTGLPVCTACGSQFNDIYNRQNHIITADGNGSVIVTWHDGRNGNNDIYAQKLHGLTGVAGEPGKITVQKPVMKIYPNPCRVYAQIYGLPLGTEVKMYDITGRLVERTGDASIGRHLPAGVYFITAPGYQTAKLIKLR